MLNLQVRKNYDLMGIIVSLDKQKIDMILLYRLLKIIHESPGISMTQLHRRYTEETGINVNYRTIQKHIEYAELKGLVEVRKGKPTILKITNEGINYLYLLSRVLSLLRESI